MRFPVQPLRPWTALALAVVLVFQPFLAGAEIDMQRTLQEHDPQGEGGTEPALQAPSTPTEPPTTAPTATPPDNPWAPLLERLTRIFERLTRLFERLVDIIASREGRTAPPRHPGSSRPGPEAPSTPPRNDSGTRPTTPSSTLGPPPYGREGIERMFGPPGQNQVTVTMPAGPGGRDIPVTCHRLIADKLRAVFEEIKAKGLSREIHTFDGCYNNRNKRGGTTKSTHAWGIAVDLNASENPMGQRWQTPGQKKLAEIFLKHGFTQVENDYMHFQYCRGY